MVVEKTVQKKSILDDPFIKFKLARQICLILTWTALGFMLEVIGPTMQDLMEVLDVTYEGISLALVGKSTGFFVGSLLGGFLHEIFHSKTDLVMAIGILVGAVGIAFVPMSSSLAVCGALLALTGVSEGFINTGGNTMVMDLWQDQATGPMHSLHFGFGIGAILVPQLSRPFLSRGVNPCENVTITGSCVNLTTSGDEEYRESNLDVLYIIVGIIVLVLAIATFIFFLLGRPAGFPERRSTTKIRKLLSPATCAAGDTRYGAILMALLFLYFIQATGGERAAGKFLASFAVDAEVGFSKDEAASLLSVFWFCHMCGRFSGTFIGHFVPVQAMIAGEIAGMAVSSAVLAAWGYTTATVLWAATSFLGFFISFLFPSGMAWGNVYMHVNSMGVMVFLLGAASGGYIYQYLPGYLLDTYGARSLTYVFIAVAVIIAAVYTVMTIFVKTYQKTNLYTVDTGNTNESCEYDDEKDRNVEYISYVATDGNLKKV